MSVLTLKELLQDAKTRKYAVGSFTVFNMEFVRAVIQAAEECNSPVIVAFGPVETDYAGMERLSAVCLAELRRSKVPVALHLDHGNSFELAVSAMRNGFTSVMLDASRLPYQENIAATSDIVKIAKVIGVSVEGEIGKIAGCEDGKEVLDDEATITEPDEALDFARRTGVDALAIAIGTAHGFYRRKPEIRIDRLKEIVKTIDTPLVLHGGSDTPAGKIREAIAEGITKVNICSELKAGYVNAMKKVLTEEPSTIDVPKIMLEATNGVVEIVKQKLELFGSVGKA